MKENNGLKIDGLYRVDGTHNGYGISKGGLWGYWDDEIATVLYTKWADGGGNYTSGTLLIPEEML